MEVVISRSGSDTSIPSLNMNMALSKGPGFESTKRNSLASNVLQISNEATTLRRFSDPNFSLITGPFSPYRDKVIEDEAASSSVNNLASSLLSPVGLNNFSCWLKNVFGFKPGGPPSPDNGDYDTMTFLMDMDGGGGLCFNDVFQKYAGASPK